MSLLSMMAFGSEDWVTGVGNEVLLALAAGLLIIVLCFYFTRAFLGWYGGERTQTEGDEDPNVNVDSGGPLLTDDQCAICLEALAFTVQTNCGHYFCGNCLRLSFRHRPFGEVIKPCPLCRTNVTLLITRFSQHEREFSDRLSQDHLRNDVRSFVSDYNRQSSTVPRSMREFITDIPFLIRNFFTDFFSLRGIIYIFQLRIGFCIGLAAIYLLSPLDIIPESVYGIVGLVDDLFVLFLLIIYLSVAYRGLVLNDVTDWL